MLGVTGEGPFKYSFSMWGKGTDPNVPKELPLSAGFTDKAVLYTLLPHGPAPDYRLQLYADVLDAFGYTMRAACEVYVFPNATVMNAADVEQQVQTLVDSTLANQVACVLGLCHCPRLGVGLEGKVAWSLWPTHPPANITIKSPRGGLLHQAQGQTMCPPFGGHSPRRTHCMKLNTPTHGIIILGERMMPQ